MFIFLTWFQQIIILYVFLTSFQALKTSIRWRTKSESNSEFEDGEDENCRNIRTCLLIT